MSGPTYDITVIGAGSVGNPAARFLAQRGLKVLVLEKNTAPGQGQNKAAIGGVRATHSDPAKISLCLRSIDHFSTFRDAHGIELGWKEGGYCFPVFDEDIESILRGLLPTQHHHGLDIDWHGPESIREIVPGINEHNLRGGTFSPGDGQVSPLMFADACWKVARRSGAVYRFGEAVTGITVRGGRVQETIDIVEACGGEVVAVLLLVDRSGGKAAFKCPVISLLQMEPETYESAKCPLCAKGVPLAHPGS